MSFRSQLRSLSLADPTILADAVALASYTQGTRLVDAPTIQTITMTPGSTRSIDVTDTQSIDLVWSWANGGPIPGTNSSTPPWYGTLALGWYDTLGQRIYADAVELAMATPNVFSSSKVGIVRTPAIGARLVLELLDADPSLPFPIAGSATVQLVKSSRSTDRFRYAGVPDTGTPDLGQLLDLVNFSFPASTSNFQVGVCEAFDGTIDLDVLASQAATLRLTTGARYRGTTGSFRRSIALAANTQTHVAGLVCPRTNVLVSLDTTTVGNVTVMANRASV